MSETRVALQDRYAPTTRCFGCGPANDKGLRIKSHVDGDAVVCRFQPAEHHQAFDGIVNGGIIGTVFDCHLNWAAAHALMLATGASAPPPTVTAEYQVTLKRPTPSDQELLVRARVVECTPPRAVVEGTMEAGGKVTATSRGVFIAVGEGHPAFGRW